MRSNVVKVAEPSFSSPILDVRDQHSQPLYKAPLPNTKRPKPQAIAKKTSLVLAPKEGWLAMALLAAAVFCVVYTISAVGWVSHTFILYWSAAAGLCVGLVVAKIHRLPQPIMHLAAILIGHWLSIWLTSVIAYHVSWGLLIAGIGAVITDPTRINNSEMVFLFYLAFLSFFLGYFGAWLLFRARLPWLVALVYCSILLINLNYVKQDLSYVVAILLAALILLVARMQLTIKLEYWKSQGLYTNRSWLRGITIRFMQIASAILVFTLLLGYALPALGQPGTGAAFWNKLDNAWVNITQNHLSLENPGSILQTYQAPTNFFGDQLTIAGSVQLPSGEVLSYTSGAAPQYLAGFSYDHFDGHTWTSSDQGSVQNYDANALLPNNTNINYRSVKTSVIIVQPPEGTKHYLFGPAQPATFDVATTLYGDPFVSAWTQQGALTKGEHYQVTSYISTATPHDLSAVTFPQDSPDYWNGDMSFNTLQMYYLQVPPSVSHRVLTTAQQWTQGANGIYDALRMLEAHLSNEAQFTYSLDNPPVPNNVDAVSWLLQTRHGYCTYYATAMTVMARLLGIPARVVNGFSRGHLDAHSHMWIVDGSDAHSWVQAYFPGYGWINFDPTPGFALNNALPGRPPTVTPTPTKPAPTATPVHKKKGASPKLPVEPPTGKTLTSADAVARQNLLVELSLTVLAASILVLVAAIARFWWRSLYSDNSIIAATYWRLCRLASWMSLSPREWQTPYEFSQVLCRRVPSEAKSVWRLTELFVRERWAAPHQAFPPGPRDPVYRVPTPSFVRLFLGLLWHKTRH